MISIIYLNFADNFSYSKYCVVIIYLNIYYAEI